MPTISRPSARRAGIWPRPSSAATSSKSWAMSSTPSARSISSWPSRQCAPAARPITRAPDASAPVTPTRESSMIAQSLDMRRRAAPRRKDRGPGPACRARHARGRCRHVAEGIAEAEMVQDGRVSSASSWTRPRRFGKSGWQRPDEFDRADHRGNPFAQRAHGSSLCSRSWNSGGEPGADPLLDRGDEMLRRRGPRNV